MKYLEEIVQIIEKHYNNRTLQDSGQLVNMILREKLTAIISRTMGGK